MEKVYIGSGKEIETQYGKMLKLSLNKGDIQKLQENMDGDWINLSVHQRREPSERGSTHYMVVDTWKPDASKDQGSQPATASDLHTDESLLF